MANYRTKMRNIGCPEVTVNALKNKSRDKCFPAKNVKKARKAEVNSCPCYPTGQTDESLKSLRIELLNDVRQRNGASLVREKMSKTFSYQRKEVVHGSPSAEEIKVRWPALFHINEKMGIVSQVNISDGVEPYGGSAFTQAEHNIVAAYLITAGVISLMSNIVVLLMFVKFKELRTATNFIIINLAFTDIGVAGIGYPMSAASDLHGSWKFGYTGCQIYAALNIFFGMASIGLLTVVAIDRYLTICRPDIGQKMTMRSYNLLILAAWLNAVFWSSMPIVGWAGYAPDPTGATCTINWRQNDASFISYTMAVIAVNFIMPLVVMFYCYYNVSATVKRYKTSNCLDSINIDWSDQMDVTKMSIVMIVMFLVAWSPYSVVCLWASFGDPKIIPAPMAIIAPLFAKSSTFYNPCIYVIANKKFRRAIIGMIRCQTRQRITINTQVPMTTSQQPLTQ